MAGQGTATLNFGAFPGGYEASVAVSAPTITATSLVEAWVFPAATADHTVDEHLVQPLRVIAGNVVAGTGFTIYGYAPNEGVGTGMTYPDNDFDWQDQQPKLYGAWNVAWVWN